MPRPCPSCQYSPLSWSTVTSWTSSISAFACGSLAKIIKSTIARRRDRLPLVAELVTGSIFEAMVLLGFSVAATVRNLCLCDCQRSTSLSSEPRPWSDACREVLPMVASHKHWSLHISTTVAWMLPSVMDGSVSRAPIGRTLLILSIAFANVSLTCLGCLAEA